MSQPAKYRTKPVEVEAVQWTGENTSDVIDWILATSIRSARWHEAGSGWHEHIVIDGHVSVGPWRASIGNWIVRRRSGDIEIYGPDSFAANYEPAADHHARLAAGTEEG